ncbi:MAG: diguanylate cyclase [Ethanoligenens sp.]
MDRLLDNGQESRPCCRYLSNIYIGNLCCDSYTVLPNMFSGQVYDIFLKKHTRIGITVVQNGHVEGLVTRNHMDHMMSGQYGYSLYARRPISVIMDRRPLVVDFQMPVDMVAKMAMARPAEKLYDCIVVTHGGRYAGIVTIKALLEKSVEIEVSNARHQNPLTGLPGNILIEQYLSECIKVNQPFAVLYIDIDNFKAYNDVYGFEKGDCIIMMLARLLETCAPRTAFVGHVGGDDFIIVLKTYAVEILCEQLIAVFDKQVRDGYTPEDLQKGFIVAKNRKGEIEQFPVMSISIAGVTNKKSDVRDVFHLAELAVGLKKRCKRRWTSSYIVE